MKNFFAFLTAFLLVFTDFAVSADEGKYQTAGDLYQAWCDDLPDYICGVWSANGGNECLTFGIQNTDVGNAGKQEMLDLIIDDTTVSFVYQTYSRNYLVQVQDELYEYFIKDIGLVFSSLNETENRIDLGIYYKRKDDAETKEMIAELTAKYGDAVTFENTDLIYTTELVMPLEDVFAGMYQDKYIFPAALGILILTAALGLVARRKNIAALATNTGNTVDCEGPLTAKEVERAVRESDIPLPSNMDARILKKIEQINKQH